MPPQYWQYPDVHISTSTDINFDLNTLRLIPVIAGDGVLMVYLPSQNILIAPFFGKYLPDAGFLTDRMKSSVTSW